MNLADAKGQGILASWVLTIIRALEKQSGLSRDDILQVAQLDGDRLQQGSNRYSQQEVTRLWVCARELAGNPAFGLCVAQQVRPVSFHVVGHLMACSVTPYRALERLARYCRLLSDATAARLINRGEQVTLEFLYDLDKSPPVAQSYDTVLASILHLLREVSGERICPCSVSLRYSDTELDPAFDAFFSCAIEYGATQECLTFNRADLDKPILAADEELANLLEGVAREQLDLRMRDRLPLRVRDALISQFSDGPPTKSATAQMLHMSERTMLRRLSEQGQTYSGVLNQLREDLAFQYIRQGNLSLSAIAERLGFSDYWAFSRAFKRWTGQRPGQVAKGR